MKLWRQAIAAVVILAAAGAAYLFAWPKAEEGGAAKGRSGGGRATAAILAPAEFAFRRTRIEAVGTADAVRSAVIHAAVAGEVVEVAFRPNQRVKAGDVLLRLGQRKERLAVDLARVRVKDARQLVARLNKTRGTGAVAATTVDQARTALEEARIQLRQAEAALDDRTVAAPFDGVVGLTEIDVGDRIDPDDAIATLDDRSSLLISFSIPELFLGRIDVGARIAARPWAAGVDAVAGEIVDVDSRIDPATRSFRARALTPNPDDSLRPGMGFAVSMELVGKRYLLAPEAAVQWGAAGAFLWVVRDGKAKRIDVRIVERREGSALVEADVAEGEPIVIEGIQRMRDGGKVRSAEPGGGS